MIIKLKKILIFGLKKQLDVFFKAAQEKGFIEFFGSTKKAKKVSDSLKDYINAIKILKRQPSQTQAEETISAQILIKNILHLNETLEKFLEELRMITSEIARIAPFGDFALDDLHKLENEIHRYFQFFTIKKSNREKLKIEDELIYINSAYDLDYFVAINHERKTYPKMIEMYIDVPLKVLKEKKELLEEQIQNAQHELKHLAKHLKYIQKELVNELNVFNLDSAKLDSSMPMDQIFTVQGWVPEDKIENLKLLTKNLNVDFVETQIEKTDRVPTYLENKKSSKIGEDLIKIYDIPSTTDKDPSMWVLIFFAIFFAIIISDAGYGLFYLGIGLLLKWRVKNPKPFLRRFISLILILSTTTIIWGAIIGSFFGLGIDPDSKYDKYSILNQIVYKKTTYHMHEKDDVYQEWTIKYPKIKGAKTAKDFLIKAYNPEEKKFEAFETFKGNVLMEISLFIGVVHIVCSLFRYLKRNIVALGWIAFLIGGYLYLPSLEDATSFINYFYILDKTLAVEIGKILFFAGIGFAVIVALILKRLHGADEITKSVSIFADVLSYLRLYALSLAGAIMAATVNNFAASAGWFFGIILIIFGHALNLLLNVMGGVIHGLRLNFIEWYHYSFEGDGKLFNPLKLLK